VEQVTRPVLKVSEDGPTGVDFGLLRAMYLRGEEARPPGDPASGTQPSVPREASEVTRALSSDAARTIGAEVTRSVGAEVTRAVESEATKSIDVAPSTRAPSEFPTRIVGMGEEIEPDEVQEADLVDDDDEDRTLATEAPSHMESNAAAPNPYDLTQTKAVAERPAGVGARAHPADDEPRTMAMENRPQGGAPVSVTGPEPRVDEYGATMAIPPESVPRPVLPDYSGWGAAPPSGAVPAAPYGGAAPGPTSQPFPSPRAPMASQPSYLQPPPNAAPQGGFFPPPQGVWQPPPPQAPNAGPQQSNPSFPGIVPAGPPPPQPYRPRTEDNQRMVLVAMVLGCAVVAAIGLALIISNLR
jgi:hypothetical protein